MSYVSVCGILSQNNRQKWGKYRKVAFYKF